MDELFPFPPNQQAVNQLLAIIVTLAFAVLGGIITGINQLYTLLYLSLAITLQYCVLYLA